MNTKILPVKSFQETLGTSMCGPASLLMVLDFGLMVKSDAILSL